VRAVDAASGETLAETAAVMPVSTELGCRSCHGGEWKAGVAGIGAATADDVLAVHDRVNKTNLRARAQNGQPAACQECHPDPAHGQAGQPGMLNLSAAIHGWHANYLGGFGDAACQTCHPDDPTGATASFRGWHAAMGFECSACHGSMDDHALALLKHEQQAGKAGAARLMAHLTPQSATSIDDIAGREPWTMQPDCAGCHDFTDVADASGSAFNAWAGPERGALYRERHDDMGAVACQACHGPTHAEYPADNIYGADRDNIQPLQYQGVAAPLGADGHCAACHGEEMDVFVHHPLPGM